MKKAFLLLCLISFATLVTAQSSKTSSAISSKSKTARPETRRNPPRPDRREQMEIQDFLDDFETTVDRAQRYLDRREFDRVREMERKRDEFELKYSKLKHSPSFDHECEHKYQHLHSRLDNIIRSAAKRKEPPRSSSKSAQATTSSISSR